MEARLSILFYGKKTKQDCSKTLSIYLRATIAGERFEVTTHQHVKPSEWSASAGKVRGRSETAAQVNTALDLVKKKVYDYKERIRIEERDFTVNSLREKWFGQDRNTRTLLEVFRLSIFDLEKLVAKGIYKRSTLVKYLTTERHLIDFLKWRNTGLDVLLVDLRLEFANQFVYYLQAEKGMTINSSGKMIKNLKKVIRDCVDKDWLDKDPFWLYKVKHIDYKVPHLSAEELKTLEEMEIAIPRLALVRDMFMFSCYTGFAYVDVAHLTADHIKTGVDGKKWLIKNRNKTDISERVPILPPVEKILYKYANYSGISN